MALLEIRDIRKRFGGLKALDGVGMDVSEGELVGLIGHQPGPALPDHLALLTEGEGQHAHVDAGGEIMRDGASGHDRLVVRVRVQHQHAAASELRRRAVPELRRRAVGHD